MANKMKAKIDGFVLIEHSGQVPTQLSIYPRNLAFLDSNPPSSSGNCNEIFYSVPSYNDNVHNYE